MKLGVVGKKIGMTRVFAEDGGSVPVTVIAVDSNRVTGIKNVQVDGYSAVQVAYGSKKSSRVNKCEKGLFSKAEVGVGQGLHEFRAPVDALISKSVGGSFGAEELEGVQYVDVTAHSKGKGFQGVIKRWNFSAQDATHGNSLSHRAPGSIGQNQSPGRVFKGKKMAGHMGSSKVTVQNLRLIKVDIENNIILIKGAVPGSIGMKVVVRPASKKENRG